MENVAFDQDGLPKSTKPVVPSVLGATTLSVTPPAEYPVPDISFDVLYAVVAASSDALLLYKAILNVSDVKSCTASNSSFLKLVHSAVFIAILYSYGVLARPPIPL